MMQYDSIVCTFTPETCLQLAGTPEEAVATNVKAREVMKWKTPE